MKKDTIHHSASLIPWVIAACCLIWGLTRGEAHDESATIKSCKIPSNYCESSIKGLEEELKIAHETSDRYEILMGEDKARLIDNLESCERFRMEVDGVLNECQHEAKKVIECSHVLNKCNDSLEECTVILEKQCNIEWK